MNAYLASEEIEQVQHLKFLGVCIDEQLTWNNHITHLLFKLSSALFVLNRISKVCALSTRLTTYHSVFHSHISYCILLWGSTSEMNLLEVFKCQKKALRSILHLKRNEPCKVHFQKHKIFTIYAQYVYQLLLKIKKNECIFSSVGESHHYNTRNGHLLRLQQNKLKIKSNLPSQAGITYFNLLSKPISNLNMSAFKRKIKTELLALAPYSFEEVKKCLPTLKLDKNK